MFTAGVGERGPIIREKAIAGLDALGIVLDPERNAASVTRNAETEISAANSPVKVFVIPTDEELVMTEDTYAIMNGSYNVHTNFTYSFQNPAYVNKEREEALKKDIKKRPGLEQVIVRPNLS